MEGYSPWEKYHYTIYDRAEYEEAKVEIMDRLDKAEKDYKEASQQLWNFDQNFAELEYKHDQVANTESRSAGLSWRRQLETLLFIRNMYQRYAKMKGAHLDILKEEVRIFLEPQPVQSPVQ